MKARPAFSLIELTISVTLIAIVMYSAIAIYITAGARSVNVEKFSVAQSLAEGKLEQVMARSFNAVTSEAVTAYTGDFAGYSYDVTTNYVTRDALDQAWASSTDYKKIRVRVWNTQLTGPVSLESLRTNY